MMPNVIMIVAGRAVARIGPVFTLPAITLREEVIHLIQICTAIAITTGILPGPALNKTWATMPAAGHR